MARAFETVIRLQLDKYGPEAARRKHIAIARKGLADYLATQNPKPAYEIETDGRPAASEESVRQAGIIVYRFRRMREIALFCLEEAIRLSPRGTKAKKGPHYAESWFVLVDGQPVAIDKIPPDAKQIHVTNDAPYSRKINVGSKGFEKYVPPGLVEKVRQLAIRRYASIATIEVDFLQLSGGYTLLTNPKPVAAKQNRKSSAFREGRSHRRARILKGQAMRYPAVSIRPKF